MHYGKILYADIANGVGCRTSLFVSGCTHHCKGCFNEVTWDFNYGEKFTHEVEDKIIESIQPSYINGLTILGGEPMEFQNQQVLLPFIHLVKSVCPDKTIWVYSGYTWEELLLRNDETTKQVLNLIDVLVDGEFIIEQKDITLKYRGSKNQRIIDVKKSLLSNSIVLWSA